MAWLSASAALGAAALAAGEFRTVPLGLGGVSVTNDQAHSSWDLSGVLIRFAGVSTERVEIARESGGTRYVLAAVPAGATSVWWWAWQPVPCKFGDFVSVSGGGVTGVVQVLQQPGR